jgi:hypothetical protein
VSEFGASFHTATSSRHGMCAGLAQVGLIHPIFPSLYEYVNDIPTRSHHFELALIADNTAIITTSRKPTLLVSYLASYLCEIQRWLSEWRTVIHVPKSAAIIFAQTGQRFSQPRPLTLFGDPILRVDTACYLGVTLDKRLNWSSHFE